MANPLLHLKGAQFELRWNEYAYQAFIAEIDPEKGLTIHLLDPSEYLPDDHWGLYGRGVGEIVCINFDEAKYSKATIACQKKIFDSVVVQAPTGVVEIVDSVNGAYATCAFK